MSSPFQHFLAYSLPSVAIFSAAASCPLTASLRPDSPRSISIEASEERHDALEAAKPVVHGHKMLPSHRLRVMPAAVQHRLDWQHREETKGGQLAAAAVPVDVGDGA